MPYATQVDMIARFGEDELIELTDRDNAGAINAAVVEGALADAESEINSYLASRISLPLADVPRVLTLKACDMARYFLEGANVREEVKERYEAAVRFLRDVAAGKAQLGNSPQAEPAPTIGGPQFIQPKRVFNIETLRDF